MWSDAEFQQHGGTYQLLTTALQQYHRANADERNGCLVRIVKLCEDYNEYLREVSEDRENAAVDAVSQQANAELATPQQQARLPLALRQRFQSWAHSWTARRTPGPIQHVESTYRSELASRGRVGKEVGPRLYDGHYAAEGRDIQGVSFIDWLDSEEGRRALIAETIMNSDLRDKHVMYLENDQLPDYRLTFRGGLIFRGAAGGPFHPPDDGHADGWAIYVMDLSNDIYVGYHDTGLFHHSSFLRGAPVKAAGKLLVQRGVIVGINAHSGHYSPTDQHTLNLLRVLLVKFNEAPAAGILAGAGKAEMMAAYKGGHAASMRSQGVVGSIKVQQAPPASSWYMALDFLRNAAVMKDTPAVPAPML